MDIILKQDVINLGYKNDIVTVKLDKHAIAYNEKKRKKAEAAAEAQA